MFIIKVCLFVYLANPFREGCVPSAPTEPSNVSCLHYNHAARTVVTASCREHISVVSILKKKISELKLWYVSRCSCATRDSDRAVASSQCHWSGSDQFILWFWGISPIVSRAWIGSSGWYSQQSPLRQIDQMSPKIIYLVNNTSIICQ